MVKKESSDRQRCCCPDCRGSPNGKKATSSDRQAVLLPLGDCRGSPN
ncbi:hypothetical protein AVEN_257890-1, partial [Araneus ventricosus]